MLALATRPVGTEGLYGGGRGGGSKRNVLVKLTVHVQLVARLGLHGALPPLSITGHGVLVKDTDSVLNPLTKCSTCFRVHRVYSCISCGQ